MATTTQYTCDVCGKPKGATNHWYALVIYKQLINVWLWSAGYAQSGALHICGEACLLKKISERLRRSRRSSRGSGTSAKCLMRPK